MCFSIEKKEKSMYNKEKELAFAMTFFDPMFDRKYYAAFELNYTEGIKHPDRTFFQHDFIYIIDGEWEIYQEDKKYIVKQNDVIILTANSRHYGKNPCLDNTKTMYIHTNAAPCEQLNKCDTDDSGLIPLDPLIHCGTSGRIRHDFERIISCFSLDRPYRQQRLHTAFSTLLLDLFDVQNQQRDYADDEMVVKLCRLLTDRPNKFYSNKELADKFYLGEKTFVERFKKMVDVTPHQYQLMYKLQNIKTIMQLHPEIRLRELAINNGFCDEFHLSKTFKRYYGISPYQFKKKK